MVSEGGPAALARNRARPPATAIERTPGLASAGAGASSTLGGTGGGIAFNGINLTVPPTGNLAVKISNIRVSAWDGRVVEYAPPDSPGKADTLRLDDDSAVSGKLVSIDSGKILFSNAQGAAEELHLKELFGADYENYLAAVPRYLPKFSETGSARQSDKFSVSQALYNKEHVTVLGFVSIAAVLALMTLHLDGRRLPEMAVNKT